MHQPARQQKTHQQHRDRVSRGHLPVQIELEAAQQRPHDHALQAVGTAGEPVELVGQLEQDQRETQRDHDAGEIGAAHDGERAESAECGGRRGAHHQTHHRVGVDVFGKQRRAVRPEAQEGRMAQGDDAGVAQDQVQRDRKQRDDGDLVDDQRVLLEQPGRGQRGQPEHGLPGAPAGLVHQAASRR
ncbi:hypothetical protein D9M68_790450 [compost metagenome]